MEFQIMEDEEMELTSVWKYSKELTSKSAESRYSSLSQTSTMSLQ